MDIFLIIVFGSALLLLVVGHFKFNSNLSELQTKYITTSENLKLKINTKEKIKIAKSKNVDLNGVNRISGEVSYSK